MECEDDGHRSLRKMLRILVGIPCSSSCGISSRISLTVATSVQDRKCVLSSGKLEWTQRSRRIDIKSSNAEDESFVLRRKTTNNSVCSGITCIVDCRSDADRESPASNQKTAAPDGKTRVQRTLFCSTLLTKFGMIIY